MNEMKCIIYYIGLSYVKRVSTHKLNYNFLFEPIAKVDNKPDCRPLLTALPNFLCCFQLNPV